VGAELQTPFDEVLCEVGSMCCGPDGDVQWGNRPGTFSDDIRECALTCARGECRVDSCQTAFQAAADGRKHDYSVEFDGLSDAYTLEGGACRQIPYIEDGAEAVFEVEEHKYEVITVGWDQVASPTRRRCNR
jgi:hypothetical protein